MKKVNKAPLLLFITIAFFILFPLIIKNSEYSYVIRFLGIIGIYVILALGLNVTLGFVGLFDLGYMAFYAIGAYTSALLAIHGFGFWICTMMAIIVSVTVRLILGAPVLRLRGDYLAIVTLGFGEITRLVLNNWDSLTNGPKGLPRIGQFIDSIHLFKFEFTENIHFYYLILAFVVVTVIISKRLETSRIGRAWTAVREDEIAAELTGVPVTRVKMLAFATSAIFAGIAGSLFVHWEKFVTPESFTFWESVIVVSMVVLGGMGSVYGVILGAIVIAGFPLLLQTTLGSEYIHYRYLLFGLALIITVIFRPQGLIPSTRHALELKPEGSAE